MKSHKLLPLAGLTAALFSPTSLSAAPLTWTGDVDSNWSTDNAGDTNWSTNTVPADGDTAIFSDAALGVNSTVDAATTIDFLTINQSTTTATNKITLGADLTIDANDTTGSGITYGSTITNAAMFEMDLNGSSLDLTTNNGNGISTNLYGTYTMDTAGSRIRMTRTFGTGAADVGTLNFGNTTNLSVVNVTAAAEIGFRNNAPGNSTSNNTRLTTINIGSGSEVNVSNNATLNFLRRGRVAANVKSLEANNSGTINLESGSTLAMQHIQVNTNNNDVGLQLNNLASGSFNHNGTVAFTMPDRGNSTITNAGTWNVGTAATVTAELNGQGTGDTGTLVLNNQAGGVITGANATTSLDYNPLDTATFLNQTLTITNAGIISAGVGHNGTGTSSVGTMSFTDINIDASTAANSFRFDLASTSSFDIINLNTGTLALDNTLAILDVYFVNGFNPNDGDSFDIINASAITGNFTSINIFNGSGSAANSDNWSFDNSSGVLAFAIPEPSSALLAMGSLTLLLGLRRRY